MEKQCGCFKRSDFKPSERFDTREEALAAADARCKTMNIKFCHKHKFTYEENENKIIIKMKVAK